MFIDIRAIGFDLTDSLRGHVQSRLQAALGPFAGRVLKATVRLEDVNAGRGGIDKRCSVTAALRRRSTLIAESIHPNLYSAIDESAIRIRRSVLRQITRRIGRQRRTAQRPGALIT
jgi:ribosome-associated translation inhibitor RaiA